MACEEPESHVLGTEVLVAGMMLSRSGPDTAVSDGFLRWQAGVESRDLGGGSCRCLRLGLT